MDRKYENLEKIELEDGRLLLVHNKRIGFGPQYEILLVRGMLIPRDGSSPKVGWFLVEMGISGAGQYATILSELDRVL